MKTEHEPCYRDFCWCDMKVGTSSPLGNEVGLSLFYLFNQGARTDPDTNDATIPPYFYRSTINSAASGTVDVNNDKDRESLFARCLFKCCWCLSSSVTHNNNRNFEAEFNVYGNLPVEHITEHLFTEFNDLFQGKLLCTRQKLLPPRQRGKTPTMVDLMISTPSNQTSFSVDSSTTESILETEPVSIYEIGLQVKQWWRHFERGGQAVKAIMESTTGTPAIACNQPLLLFVLTCDIRKQIMNGRSTNQACMELMIENWAFGVFLCWKGEHDKKSKCNTSLLWRGTGESIQSLSTAFAKTIYATEQLVHWRNQKDERFMYLGEHCCQFTYPDERKTVLRCYDSRFQPTHRKRSTYLLSEKIFGIDNHHRKILSHVSFPDRNHTTDHEYGLQSAFNYCEDGQWLWYWHGNFTIIEIPYLPRYGEAITPTCPGDFLPIIRDLRYLHRMSIVHGDIQLKNMVLLGGDPTTYGCRTNCGLINLDWGGTATTTTTTTENDSNAPTYRPDYAVEVMGGCLRRTGWPKYEIRMGKDWMSLVQIIFYYHYRDPIGNTTTYEIDNDNIFDNKYLARQYELEKLFQNLIKTKEYNEELQCAIDRLESYIHTIRDWTVYDPF